MAGFGGVPDDLHGVAVAVCLVNGDLDLFSCVVHEFQRLENRCPGCDFIMPV